jgi:hypothetical protein
VPGSLYALYPSKSGLMNKHIVKHNGWSIKCLNPSEGSVSQAILSVDNAVIQ